MKLEEIISTNILRLKNETKASIETIAEETSLGKSKIKGFIYLKQSPKINELQIIANYFGVDVIDLITKIL